MSFQAYDSDYPADELSDCDNNNPLFPINLFPANWPTFI